MREAPVRGSKVTTPPTCHCSVLTRSPRLVCSLPLRWRGNLHIPTNIKEEMRDSIDRDSKELPRGNHRHTRCAAGHRRRPLRNDCALDHSDRAVRICGVAPHERRHRCRAKRRRAVEHRVAGRGRIQRPRVRHPRVLDTALRDIGQRRKRRSGSVTYPPGSFPAGRPVDRDRGGSGSDCVCRISDLPISLRQISEATRSVFRRKRNHEMGDSNGTVRHRGSRHRLRDDRPAARPGGLDVRSVEGGRDKTVA